MIMVKRNIVRLFELRKAHLDYRINRDYVRNGIATIPCRISGYNDIISPFSVKGCESLTPDFFDYLTASADVTPAECPLVLNIIGGSLGARTINNAIISGLQQIGEASYNVQVLWQTGKIYDRQCREALEASGVKNVSQMAFISNMDMAYRAADLVVSRAGASSISELQLLGKPAILVPSPNVAEDHQTKNAMALSTRDAAIMVTDADASALLVDTMLKTVTDDALLTSLGDNVSKMALRDAAERIVDEVESIIHITKA